MPLLPRKSFGDAEERLKVVEQQISILDDYLIRMEAGDNLPISAQSPLPVVVDGGEVSGIGGEATGGAQISGIAHDSHQHGVPQQVIEDVLKDGDLDLKTLIVRKTIEIDTFEDVGDFDYLVVQVAVIQNQDKEDRYFFGMTRSKSTE